MKTKLTILILALGLASIPFLPDSDASPWSFSPENRSIEGKWESPDGTCKVAIDCQQNTPNPTCSLSIQKQKNGIMNSWSLQDLEISSHSIQRTRRGHLLDYYVLRDVEFGNLEISNANTLTERVRARVSDLGNKLSINVRNETEIEKTRTWYSYEVVTGYDREVDRVRCHGLRRVN